MGCNINKINISKNTLMYNFENITIKDKFNQKTSGLNHILCKSLKKKNIPIIYPITTFFNSKNQQKLFGKILQNIKLCKKYKNIIILTSFAKHPKEMISPHDLIAYGIILGLTPTQAKKSIFNIHNLILLNKKKKTGKLITEGVELLD